MLKKLTSQYSNLPYCVINIFLFCRVCFVFYGLPFKIRIQIRSIYLQISKYFLLN